MRTEGAVVPDRSSSLVVRRTLSKAEEHQFIELPFEVPTATEAIHGAWSVDGVDHPGAIIDLGLRDPQRVRGWSGGARCEFSISPTDTTPGYLPGPIQPGPWAVIVASNRLPLHGCTVTLRITFTPAQARWLKGDLHTHTNHSGGDYSLDRATELALAADLDFVALTDHNTISQNFAYPRNTPLIFIPGMELTTYRGHVSLLGCADPQIDPLITTELELQLALQQAQYMGAIVVRNHPYDDDCGWRFDSATPFDWLEVWSGPWRPSNQRAVNWWQTQLASGRRIVGVGGSDVHRDHPHVRHGWPTTWVWSEERTIAAILGAIDRGHCSVSFAPFGPQIELWCGEAMMGDLVEIEDDALITVRVQCVNEGDAIKLISDRSVERTFTVWEDGTFTYQWPANGRRFWRVEVWRYFEELDMTLMAALSNPIYLQTVLRIPAVHKAGTDEDRAAIYYGPKGA